MKRLVLDLDDTLTISAGGRSYGEKLPRLEVIEKTRMYKAAGFEIVIQTARNMRTYQGNIGKINIHTVPTVVAWLTKNGVPFDEIIVGKPWCGFEGFYVDDRAVRPDEFVNLAYDEIDRLIGGVNRD